MFKTIFTLIISGFCVSATAQDSTSLEGLWKAHKRFDTYMAGPLVLDFADGTAEMAGHRERIQFNGERFTIAFPDAIGSVHGRQVDGVIKAHWRQPGPIQLGMPMATPVLFKKLSNGVLLGRVTPMPSQFTFFLPVTRDEEGVMRTFLRNPERNLGVFAQVNRLESRGGSLELIGRFRGSDKEQVLLSGYLDSEFDRFTVRFPPWRGGVYDFYRDTPESESDFHARPASDGPWQYQPPPGLDDGWPVATLESAGIDEAPIRKMITEEITKSISDVHGLYIHGVLIARGGQLVLEEYFHGFHRDMPHDTRSAGKSLASVLAGAMIHQGVNLSVDTPVYAALGENLENLDERKRAMTLEHLLTMTSGFHCDDNDSDAPGNEDTMQSQEEQPDWYRYTLDLPMVDDPGASPVYCSAVSNLIGAVISAKTGQPLTELVQDFVAEPLGIKRYWLDLQPTGELYFGGGSYWLPRDYMKLAQLMLNGGVWNGQRIVSEDWARQSTSESVRLRDRAYAWQWWVNEYDWHGRKVKAFFAAGNGGQIFMGIPEADLVVAFWGGNYSDRVLYHSQNVLIPKYILPATMP